MELQTTTLLDLGSDLSLRYRYFVRASMAHPAKLHLGLLAWIIERYTRPGDTILDPMGGIGSVLYAALLQRSVILRDVEPRWLALAHENAALILREAGFFAGAIDIGQADAREPWGVRADHIIFSPPYSCAMGVSNTAVKGVASHRARKALEAGTKYARIWERAASVPGCDAALRLHYGAHPAQIGHWRGDRYWSAMADVYTHARAALKPGGRMALVIKDHIRNGARVCVAAQTVELCEALGFRLIDRAVRRVYPLSLWQRRRKEKGEPVIEDEDVLVFALASEAARAEGAS